MMADWIRRLFSSGPDTGADADSDAGSDAATLGRRQKDDLLEEGNTAMKAGNYMQALNAYKEVMRIQPENATVHFLASEVYKKQGEMDSCEDSLKLALHYDPHQYKACFSLGNIFLSRKEYENAGLMYSKALEGVKDNARLYCNLGISLYKQDRNDEAEECFRKSLELNQENVAVLNNLAIILFYNNRVQEAQELVRRAISLSPEYEQAHKTYASSLRELGRKEEALEHVDKVLSRNEASAALHWQKSLILLDLGRCQEGWREYEWGLQTGDRIIQGSNIKRWQGEDLADKAILVRPEQGLGDEIRLASCIPDLIRTAGRVFVECDQRLEELYERSFPEATIIGIRRKSPPVWDLEHSFDYQVPLGSLPLYFRPTVESFPRHHGYLVADEHRQARWRERLALLGSGPKIGIVWRSHLSTGTRQREYPALSDWTPVLNVPGVHFVNLQYDECTDELLRASRSSGARITDFTDLDHFNDIEGVAALLSTLDLVISAAVSVAELAGALGEPVWKLSRNSSWTMLGTCASPWYPATRIFMQEEAGAWSTPIAGITSSLQAYVAEWSANSREPVN